MKPSVSGVAVQGLVALVLAVTLSVGGWWTLVSPWAFQHVHIGVMWALNIIPATAGVLTGRGSVEYFMGAAVKPCDFCTPTEHLVNYLALAIPAYIFVFTLVVAALRWRRRRRLISGSGVELNAAADTNPHRVRP